MTAFQQLIDAMRAGRDWSGMGDPNQARELMTAVYAERYHGAAYYKDRYQLRANLQKNEEAASYAGWITADNPTSGAYQGTSFVWFPGVGGSIAVLVIGTDGFGADSHILGRPGHGRRLRALRALHQGRLDGGFDWYWPGCPLAFGRQANATMHSAAGASYSGVQNQAVDG